MTNYLHDINSPSDLKKLSPKQLPDLAQEIRQQIIETTAENGGHLASNLGVVELTIALHYVLNTPTDKIIWDVGHQCYAHKLLTGRKEAFSTLRQPQGLSGFCNKEESPYDIFTTGHSSNSLSLALGMAVARDLDHGKEKIVAVIGDGALTGGMAFEALNNAGDTSSPFVIILNDNGMSIGGNVGGLARYLSNLRSGEKYNRLKNRVYHALARLPFVGKGIAHFLRNLKRSVKAMLVPGMIFENLGILYLGPVDGHDIGAMTELLNRALKMKKTTLIHIKTVKGKGYIPAEMAPSIFHGTGPFYVSTGLSRTEAASSYTDVFADTLIQIAKKDRDVIAITAAMLHGTGLEKFRAKMPERVFDVGIAEQHAVTLAGGLAAQGKRPVVAIYSCFLQRAYDQIIEDVCLQNLPVIFAIDRAGIVGQDGVSHQGIYDISYLRCIPGLVFMAPADQPEFALMLNAAFSLHLSVAIRYPRARANRLPKEPAPIQLGKSTVMREGTDVAIFAIGTMVESSLACADILAEKGLSIAVINARFIYPLDKEVLLHYARLTNGKILTVEENVCSGGFGAACAEALSPQGYAPQIAALPARFIPHGERQAQLKEFGLDAFGLAERILRQWYPERKQDHGKE